jgi:hypothetical protein
MKSSVFDMVQWDPSRGFYKEEDVDFSNKLKARHLKIKFNPYSTTTHNDERYHQKGNVLIKDETFVEKVTRIFRNKFG